MKKFLLLAAALLAFAGCKEKENQPTPQADEISVSPAERTVGGEGGEVSVTVTSTGDWTLAASGNATYDWVTSSKASGKSGDKVVFTVEPNTESEKTAEFIFSCGEAQAAFKLISTPQEVIIPTIEVTSANPVEVGSAAGTFQVTLNVSETVDATALKAESDGDWITFESAAAGSSAGTAVMNFSYSENKDEKVREATVTITYPNADAETVTVSQAAAQATEIELTSPAEVEVGASAGTIEVTFDISGNVNPLDITGRSTEDWLTFKGVSQNVPGTAVVTFEYQANTASTSREAHATVSYDDMDYATVTVTQKAGSEEPVFGDYYITKVPYMKYHCTSVTEWKTPEAVNNLGKTYTIEMLVKHDETFVTNGSGYETSYQWSGDWVGTLFGLEGRVVIRQGDNTANYKQWELVCGRPNGEYKLRSSKDLEGDVWTHIAVVLDGTTATLYQDGENVGSGAFDSDIYDLDLTEKYSGYEQDQEFHIGRSYNNARDFCGMMSEVRIWNRALTQDEINAKDHFYYVDPSSEGLVAYWKMNEGEGTLLKDSTPNGNDMTCYKLDIFYPTNPYKSLEAWSPSAEWHDVELGPVE